MASTEKLPSGKYRGVYRDANGKKQHTPPRDRKQDAKDDADEAAVKARRVAAVETGTLSAKTTWGAWVEIWWADREIELSTAATESAIRDRDLIPQWGDTQLNRISRPVIQKWVTKLSGSKGPDGKQYAASYVNRTYGLFRTSILAAVDEGVLLASPCVKIKLPKIAATRKRSFEQEEVDAFLPMLRVRHREAVELLLETGLRPGELAGLHWDHVSLTTGWMTVAEVYVRLGKVIKGTPKDEDARDVPLTSRAIEILRKWQTEIPPGTGCGLRHSDGKACRSDLVYRQLNGSPLSLTSLRDTFARALERAKVATGSPYDLRHTFATRLAEGQVDAFEIARLLGHATVNQSTTYIHRTAAARDRVLAALGDRSARGLNIVGRGTERGTEVDNQAPSDVPIENTRHAG